MKLNVWVAGGVCEGGQPVETGEYPVLNSARLDLTRPADDTGNAEPAFKTGALGGLKGCHPTIRPGEYFRTIVGGEDHDRVVGFADVLQMLQKRPDTVVQLGHARFLQTIVGLIIHE